MIDINNLLSLIEIIFYAEGGWVVKGRRSERDERNE
jgi:hypothetical protein